MKTKLPHLLTFAALLAFPALTQAQTITSAVPGTISYQGRVLSANGQPVGAGTPVNRTVIFRIWDSPSNTLDANLLYSEAQTVTIAEGEFSVLVGTGAANPTQTFGYPETDKGPPTVSLANVFNGSARFLGVTVDDGTNAVDNEITPRQQIVSSAFSFRSRVAETLGSNGATAISTLNDGRVGVGNTNPPSLFTITGANTSTSTSTPQMIVTADDVTERLRIGVDSTGNGTGFIQSFKEGTGARTLLLNPSGGDVGIGNTAPTARLDVTGGIKATGAGGYTFNTGDLDGGLFSPNDGVVTLRTNNTERLRVDGSGNVGIGTTNPVYRLQVTGGNAVISGAAAADSLGWVGVTNAGVERFGLGFAGTAGSWSADAAVGDAVLRGSTGKLLLQSGSGASAICINTSNNVGIGTSAPAENLTIATSSNNATATAKLGLVANGGHKWVMESVSGFGGGFGGGATASFQLYNTVTSTIGLAILSSGNVGIGTTTPTQGKLVVSGWTNLPAGNIGGGSTPTDSYFSAGSGTGSVGNWGGGNVSIYATDHIVGPAFLAFSDERIKVIGGRSDGHSDLETLLGIEITNYTYKDTVTRGKAPQKKVIAQQLERVFPQAVSKRTAAVPDIFKKAVLDQGWILLATDLKVGERIQLVDEQNAECITSVVEIRDDQFRTEKTPKGSQVFVYGREVKDFRTVDYEAISMLNVSATQQIKKEKDAEVKALKDENADLKARVEALEAQTKRLAELEAKDKARDAKLAAIEKLLLARDKGVAQPVLLKKSADGAE